MTRSAARSAPAFAANRRMWNDTHCSRRMADLINPSLLKPTLDRLYADFNHADSAADPIQIVRRYERSDDREVVGLVAASLAFGRVSSVLQSIERMVAIMGPRPAAYVRQFDCRRDGPAFADIVHRWTG